MREKYTRFIDNDTTTAIGCVGTIVTFTIGILAAVATNSSAVGVLALILIVIPVAVYEKTEPHASFDADDTQVTFSYLGKNTVIRYGDIKDMKITHRHNELRTRYGIHRYYVETLTITTASETHVFSAKMDIDYDKVAANPAELTVQFENSKFSQLKTYIEDRIPIMSAEKI